MSQQALRALVRLRRMTMDAARRDLAACVAEEAAAQEAALAIEMSIARETAAACNLEGGDQAVQAFAAWLQQVRPAARAADAAVELAMARTAEARAVLAAARAAAEAAETMAAREAAERSAAQLRAEQHALDETTTAATARRARTEDAG